MNISKVNNYPKTNSQQIKNKNIQFGAFRVKPENQNVLNTLAQLGIEIYGYRTDGTDGILFLTRKEFSREYNNGRFSSWLQFAKKQARWISPDDLKEPEQIEELISTPPEPPFLGNVRNRITNWVNQFFFRNNLQH